MFVTGRRPGPLSSWAWISMRWLLAPMSLPQPLNPRLGPSLLPGGRRLRFALSPGSDLAVCTTGRDQSRARTTSSRDGTTLPCSVMGWLTRCAATAATTRVATLNVAAVAVCSRCSMISQGRRQAGRDAASREAGWPLTSSAVVEVAEARILDGVATAAGRFGAEPEQIGKCPDAAAGCVGLVQDAVFADALRGELVADRERHPPAPGRGVG